MPVLTPNPPILQPPTLQAIVNSMRAYPDMNPIISAPGWTQEPALAIANDVMQSIFAEGLDWKWNRAYVPPFLTSPLQQDYMTQVTDFGWLEQAYRVDINNSVSNSNQGAKYIFGIETVRDLSTTSRQANAFQMSYVANRLATVGLWQANTAYLCGYGVAAPPQGPIQSFQDANGNLLYIDSTKLGLNLESPGYTGTPIVLPTPNPYGTSGATQPLLPAGTTPGTTVQDGGVVWTVAPPDGYSMRLGPLPALGGLTWLISPIYQVRSPYLTSLQQTIAPIPQDYTWMFRSGFIAGVYLHAGSKLGLARWQQWKESLVKALEAGDRERESHIFYPSEGLMGGGGFYGDLGGASVGPAWPYNSSY
jgi:hypothetical protein